MISAGSIHVLNYGSYCAEGSAWSYNPASRPHESVDVAHIVQAQMQMHATGASIGYLCSWSVANGSKVFKMTYSSEFMRAASEVLQHVVMKYLTSKQSPLPCCDIRNEDVQMQSVWHRMMNVLADCVASVECLGSYGKLQPTTVAAAMFKACSLRVPQKHRGARFNRSCTQVEYGVDGVHV